MNELEIAVVIEPSVFEPLKFLYSCSSKSEKLKANGNHFPFP